MFEDNIEFRDFDDDRDARLRTSKICGPSSTFRDLIFWNTNDPFSLTSDDPSEHSVSKMEAYFYYYGIHGKGTLGPKLIYRTSKDVFSIPSDQSQDLRMMEVLPADDHEKLSKEGVRGEILEDTSDILYCKDVKWATLDIVRFRWKEPSKEHPTEMITVTSPVNIWIEVHPNGANADAAFKASQVIVEHLRSDYRIEDVDVAFWERSRF